MCLTLPEDKQQCPKLTCFRSGKSENKFFIINRNYGVASYIMELLILKNKQVYDVRCYSTIQQSSILHHRATLKELLQDVRCYSTIQQSSILHHGATLDPTGQLYSVGCYYTIQQSSILHHRATNQFILVAPQCKKLLLYTAKQHLTSQSYQL